jgi:hypothetical protein
VKKANDSEINLLFHQDIREEPQILERIMLKDKNIRHRLFLLSPQISKYRANS